MWAVLQWDIQTSVKPQNSSSRLDQLMRYIKYYVLYWLIYYNDDLDQQPRHEKC